MLSDPEILYQVPRHEMQSNRDAIEIVPWRFCANQQAGEIFTIVEPKDILEKGKKPNRVQTLREHARSIA